MKELKLKIIQDYNKTYRSKLRGKDWINQNKSLIERQLKKYKTEKDSNLELEKIEFIGEECNFLLYGGLLDLYVVISFGLFSKNKWVRYNLFKDPKIETNQKSLNDLLNYGFQKKYNNLLHQEKTKTLVKSKTSELDKIKSTVVSKIKEIDDSSLKD